ncbi:MAG: Uncharacterized conserved protein, DUF1800 family [Chloroflexi bacterium]|jgi:uncharacterized protein (DUF1800 family)|nr:MAG: Uncharacterized conserved protein, DUF1800 family [Chloroflexota bacterium]
MSTTQEIALMAHLMRRAGFGSNRDELERLATQGYDATVEQLVDPPDTMPRADEELLFRHIPALETGGPSPVPGAANWLFHMVNTQRPLEEKMAFFWHHVFATGNSKVDNDNHLTIQVRMFREHGMGNYRDLLLRIARNPAMIFWLDNNENHKSSPNENWGRELLELFSLGVGHYTETDVFECARAFTGWTIGGKIPRVPYHRFSWHYEFRPEEHDYGEKTFLGHTGNFNGDDIIEIILQQPACSRFVARHLYNFFVADEAQVPAWNIEPPRDPDAIELLATTLVDSGYELKPVLRTLFLSDFFKDAMYQKVKSPVEVVVGTLRLTGDLRGADPRLIPASQESSYMGQALHDPPSVEGWQTGRDWINSGSVVQRVNFVADQISNVDLPGVQRIVERVVASNGAQLSPEALVDECVDLIGPVDVAPATRQELIAHAEGEGPVATANGDTPRRVGDMLALIAATPEYQFG